MPSAGFEQEIPKIEWLQTYGLDRTVSGVANRLQILGNQKYGDKHCCQFNFLDKEASSIRTCQVPHFLQR